jgi:hypothetical protein
MGCLTVHGDLLDYSHAVLLIKQVFEVDELEGVGSSSKSAVLNSRTQFGVDVFVNRKPLDRLVLALAELFALRYTLVHGSSRKLIIRCASTLKG